MTNRREEERERQDYLDGRLTAEQRERFEARLEREPDLARRVEACREVGQALRGGDETLSPGFFTRVRAAFEEASRGGEPRRWFRPLSWETAGLAAVVLVAAALYVPGLVRVPSGRDAFVEPEEPGKIEFRRYTPPEPVVAEDTVQNELERGEALSEPPAAAETHDADERALVAGQGVPPEPRPPVRRQTAPRGGEELGAVAADESAPAEAPRDKGEDRGGGATWAPAPPAGTPADEAATVPAAQEPKSRLRAEEEETHADTEAAGYAKKSAAALEGLAADGFTSAPAPAGLVEAGALRVIDDAEEWRELLLRSAERILEDLGGFDPGSRLVLVGARAEPFDCASLSVVATESRYWILLSPPPEGGRPAEHGCALLLPRDHRTVGIGPGSAD